MNLFALCHRANAQEVAASWAFFFLYGVISFLGFLSILINLNNETPDKEILLLNIFDKTS